MNNVSMTTDAKTIKNFVSIAVVLKTFVVMFMRTRYVNHFKEMDSGKSYNGGIDWDLPARVTQSKSINCIELLAISTRNIRL